MTEQELTRRAKRRLAMIRHAEEITGNVALTCRYYGISRQAYDTWYRRYQADGLDGLRDRSSAPLVCPNTTPTEVVGKIIYLRQHYHFARSRSPCTSSATTTSRSATRACGACSSAWTSTGSRPPSAPSAMTGAGSATRSPCPATGSSRVQIDVKFIEPLPGASTRPGSRTGSRRKHYQFTAIDDCTRLRVLRIYPRLNQKTAIQFADYAMERLPFRVEVIQTDNGAEFQSLFHYHVLDKGVGHVYIKPRTPRLNGKVERSHRIDAEEFYQLLDGVVIDDTKVFNDKLREWENFYNYHRPHGGLAGQTPYERLKQRTQARV